MPGYVFSQLTNDYKMRRYMMERLNQESMKRGIGPLNDSDLDVALQYCDRALFKKFRDGILTLSQFKAQVAAQALDTYYTVVDDLHERYDPEVLKPPSEAQQKRLDLIYGTADGGRSDPNRVLEEWEKNPRCLKSVKMSLLKKEVRPKSSHVFKSTTNREN